MSSTIVPILPKSAIWLIENMFLETLSSPSAQIFLTHANKKILTRWYTRPCVTHQLNWQSGRWTGGEAEVCWCFCLFRWNHSGEITSCTAKKKKNVFQWTYANGLLKTRLIYLRSKLKLIWSNCVKSWSKLFICLFVYYPAVFFMFLFTRALTINKIWKV